MNILAIDEGNQQSGLCVIGENYRPLAFGKFDNEEILAEKGIFEQYVEQYSPEIIIFEEISNYGSMVGTYVFQTCYALGRMYQWFLDHYQTGIYEYDPHTKVSRRRVAYTKDNIQFVKRKQYITDFTGNPKAGDPIIKQYLVDRFAPNEPNYGKGTKKNPGFFYGMSHDSWSAFGIAVWAMDNQLGNIAHL